MAKEKGFIGEGVIDSKVWIKQTRYPESKGIAEFDVHKCILVCKNMFSLIWTLFEKEIRETNTTLSMQEILQNEQLLSKFIHNEGEIIHEYFNFWLGVPIPIFVLRIEDLIFNPEDTLRNLLSFLLGIENIKGSVIENRMITFLKYNKAYTNFLEESLNQEEVISKFSTFQKVLMLKIFQEELIKFGYINPKHIAAVSFKKTIDEEEVKAIFEIQESDNVWYKENNRKSIKQSQENQNKIEKYVVSTLLKLNNLDSIRAAYT